MNKIIIILPTLNESLNIVKIFEEIKLLKKKFNILFIDDGSKDGTVKILKKLKKKI